MICRKKDDLVRLEDALIDLEKQLEVASKAAKAAHAVLKKAQASARVGNLRDLQNQLAEGRNSGKRFAEAMTQADESWTFAPEPYFADGGYLQELKEEAERQGISLFEKDARIYCFPMLLTLSEKDSAVIIDRKPERRVRPSELVKVLAARQKQPQGANTHRFLETLFDAYLVLAPQVSKD
jgi:hypothetical protein